MYGDESRSTELRLRASLELTTNYNYYRKELPKKHNTLAFGDLKEAVRESCKDFAWSGLYHIAAVAKATKTNITCHHPIVGNEQSIKHAFACTGCFQYGSDDQHQIDIMWTHTNLPKTIGTPDFTPNHFVPLIKSEMSQAQNLNLFEKSVKKLNHARGRSLNVQHGSYQVPITLSESDDEQQAPTVEERKDFRIYERHEQSNELDNNNNHMTWPKVLLVFSDHFIKDTPDKEFLRSIPNNVQGNGKKVMKYHNAYFKL